MEEEEEGVGEGSVRIDVENGDKEDGVKMEYKKKKMKADGVKKKKKNEVEVAKLPAEVEEGNCEYKFSLARASEERMLKLTSQMKWRLAEGSGEAIYMIGVEDDGSPTGIPKHELNMSIKMLKQISSTLECRVEQVDFKKGTGKKCHYAKVVIRQNPVENIPKEVRVVCLGESTCGKTTFIGVTKTDFPDDGDGSARLNVLRHQHELDQGLTSSVSLTGIHYNQDGTVDLDGDDDEVPTGIFSDANRDNSDDVSNVFKIVTLADTAGHPRYIKSAFYASVALQPDCAIVMFSYKTLLELLNHKPKTDKAEEEEVQENGWIHDEDLRKKVAVTINLLTICNSIQLPITILVSHMDDASDVHEVNGQLESVKRVILKILELGSYHFQVALNIPIHGFSSTTLVGIEEIRQYLGTLEHRERVDLLVDGGAAGEERDDPVCMYIREAFYILGFNGAILGGIPISGTVKLNDRLKLGPDENGCFYPVVVKSIRTGHGQRVSCIAKGHTATFGVLCIESNIYFQDGDNYHLDVENGDKNNDRKERGQERIETAHENGNKIDVSASTSSSSSSSSSSSITSQIKGLSLEEMSKSNRSSPSSSSSSSSSSSNAQQRPKSGSFSNQKEFFSHVVRRGTCLLCPDAVVVCKKKVVFKVDTWMSFSTKRGVQILGKEFLPPNLNQFEFVVRCSTVKQRGMLIDTQTPGYLVVELKTSPELLLSGAHVLLQHGSLLAVVIVDDNLNS